LARIINSHIFVFTKKTVMKKIIFVLVLISFMVYGCATRYGCRYNNYMYMNSGKPPHRYRGN